MIFRLTVILIFFTLLLGFAPTIMAETCKPLYNGGMTSRQVCNGTISTLGNAQPKATPTPIKIKNNSTTKGGLTVQSPTPTKKTPSTGPEVLGIIALFPAGALGYYLRKKV